VATRRANHPDLVLRPLRDRFLSVGSHECIGGRALAVSRPDLAAGISGRRL
jgi:hypothetical protein